MNERTMGGSKRTKEQWEDQKKRKNNGRIKMNERNNNGRTKRNERTMGGSKWTKEITSRNHFFLH